MISKNSISRNDKDRDKNSSKILVVPFVREVSSDIKRILKNFVDIIFTVPKIGFSNKKGQRQIEHQPEYGSDLQNQL